MQTLQCHWSNGKVSLAINSGTFSFRNNTTYTYIGYNFGNEISQTVTVQVRRAWSYPRKPILTVLPLLNDVVIAVVYAKPLCLFRCAAGAAIGVVFAGVVEPVDD